MNKALIEVGGKQVDWSYTTVHYPNEEELIKAVKYAEYSWWDIQIAFNVIGIVPTHEQELEIKTKLIHKKYSYLCSR